MSEVRRVGASGDDEREPHGPINELFRGRKVDDAAMVLRRLDPEQLADLASRHGFVVTRDPGPDVIEVDADDVTNDGATFPELDNPDQTPEH